jgi:Domain of unknown function (DUF4132)
VASEERLSDTDTCADSQAAGLLDAFLADIDALGGDWFYWVKIRTLQSVQAILQLSREQQVPVVLEAVARQGGDKGSFDWHFTTIPIPAIQCSWKRMKGLKELIQLLLRKRLPFRSQDIERLVQIVSGEPGSIALELASPVLLRALENFCEEHGVPDSLRPRFVALANRLRLQPDSAATRDALKRIDELLGSGVAATGEFLLQTDEAWTRYLRSHLERLDRPARTVWQTLLLHCNTAGQSKPSRKWLQQAEVLISAIGPAGFATVLSGLLAEIGKPGTPQIKRLYNAEFNLDSTLIHDTHSDLLRGLVWCASLIPDDNLIVSVGDAATACFKKIPDIGPRSPKIGNACLYTLSASSSGAAVGQLSRIKTRAKHASIRNQLAKAFDVAAEKTGMTEAEMEEVAVPTCGLTDVGVQRLQFGDLTATLQIVEGLKAELTWLKADGKLQKSVPASVKESFTDELKSLKQSQREIDKLLPAQRDRLEQLFLQERTWSLSEFRSRYLDHPLVGALARRLIWRYSESVQAGDGIWLDGRIVDDRDRPLAWLGDQTRVALWHPLTSSVDQVRAWRDWLDRHQVRQPFKRAHREIYVLTDAERQRARYSNRFAAHIIRQHQFAALCQQRGWRYTLQGDWDSHNIPTLVLPQWELRVEFWVGGLAEGSETSPTGVYVHLSTDQVRFYRDAEQEPMPLADVPLLVFSEVMRDVDLFVGVASVGNDPNWADGGPQGIYRDYWNGVSFGDLSATAQTRKAVLERLLPRLKIADRCSLGDRFLTVRGNLRTYKIHLGSGNILMSPNDEYLCIVPGRSLDSGSKVFLPFEGDHTLSIILSKAFLLAEDSKIKDPSIVSQIQRR